MREPEQGQQRKGRYSSILIGRDDPAPRDRRKAGDDRKGQCHADQHRQAVAQERTIRARQDKGNDRKDARADDGQHTAEIGQEKEDHVVVISS